MPVVCPVDLDVSQLRAEVQTLYDRVAHEPDGEYHFHRGPGYAAAVLGYDAGELAALPADVTSSFAGVGNPHAVDSIQPGETVVDVGCGAGTDLLLAARRVGPTGRAIGVDMTETMVVRAGAAARALGLSWVDVRPGDATALPVDEASADRVISNGVINLVPEKARAFGELFRVLKPGGRLQIADVVLGVALPESARRDVALWTG
jgi:SAM-dependent methyltransferase